jgi:hypothetical protein
MTSNAVKQTIALSLTKKAPLNANVMTTFAQPVTDSVPAVATVITKHGKRVNMTATNGENNMDETVEKINKFMIDKVNESFVMGMNYQRLRTLEQLDSVEVLWDFSDEQRFELATNIKLLEVATIADLPTPSDD